MVYGYCRVSTSKQKVERQVENILREFSDATIITEAYSGRYLDRPHWIRLRRLLKKGDTVVFDEVSRMSRDADEGFELYQELYNEGIELCFLKEKHINTATYRQALANAIALTGTSVDFILEGINKYLMSLAKEQIRLAFEQAEKEVKDIQQRTREGIVTARLNGKQIGHKVGTKLVTKKSVAAKEIIRKRSKDFEGQLPDADVMLLAGVSHNTYYKYKKELLQDEN